MKGMYIKLAYDFMEKAKKNPDMAEQYYQGAVRNLKKAMKENPSEQDKILALISECENKASPSFSSEKSNVIPNKKINEHKNDPPSVKETTKKEAEKNSSEQDYKYAKLLPIITREEAEEELNHMIGLQGIKNQISELTAFFNINNERRRNQLDVENTISLHMVFQGNPGTGKTTTARLITQILYAIGLIKECKYTEVQGRELVAGFVGQTAIKTKEIINEAMGGVLFIDEAYVLSPKNQTNDFGIEAINVLLTEMENHRDSLVVIVAGYTNEINGFINSNQGLESRFQTFLTFDDYSPDELYRIFCLRMKNKYILSPEATSLLKKHFEEVYQNRKENFSNGRYVRNLYEIAIRMLGIRIDKKENRTREDYITILEEDIANAICRISKE